MRSVGIVSVCGLYLSSLTFAQSSDAPKYDSQKMDSQQPQMSHASNTDVPSPAAQTFAQIKNLAGVWQGPVTADPPQKDIKNGALVQVSLRVTSRGNTLVHEMKDPSVPDDPTRYDHPVTMFYLDSDRLLLTHYCDAGNRPRMVARNSPDGKTVEFESGKLPYSEHGKPESLLDIALNFGLHLEHACGGNCACTTCQADSRAHGSYPNTVTPSLVELTRTGTGMDREWNDNQPIYRQLRDRVVAMILDGVLKEGDPLPSVRTVAADYRLNPLTVLKGYQELVDEKLVEKRRGLGMFVKEGARNLLLKGERQKFLEEEWPRIVAMIQRLGLNTEELLDGTGGVQSKSVRRSNEKGSNENEER